MRFYRIYGDLTKGDGADAENSEGRKRRRDLSYVIAAATEEFNGRDAKMFCFLSDLGDEVASIGMIVTERVDLMELAERFAVRVGLEAKLSPPDEITFANMQSLLRSAGRQGYIEDDDEILERFGMAALVRRYNVEYGENLVNYSADRDELFASAKSLFGNETIVPELERIYAGSRSAFADGHPVHYFVESDDRDTRREMYKIILNALYTNKRLESRRYTYLDYRPGQSCSDMMLEAIYKIAGGGAVVIRYLASDSGEDDAASGGREVVENICELARRYRNTVLTVICFQRECKKVKAEFYENLGTMSFVEIREDFVDGNAARDFLASLAKKKHIRTDKKLFFDIKDDRSYLAPELVSTFDEWYNEKLKSTVYPQYKDIAAVRKSTIKAAPKGSAYGELSEMIGLDEAKGVIKKALNYYKMQKLYAEKGVKQDNPAMHMIFTGNPGTAKTTVARLFARIMRENGLLSKGQLIEVGRGDLVGKFVGWTAQTVQAKFKEAMGGVLFIDEAYSLVDDRNGSYGDEAINTIVQEMENHREDVVVIFAGYPDKMQGFLDKNPGLRSRIAFHVPFADYTSAELCRIAEIFSKKNGMRIDDAALEKLERAFDAAKTNTDFGNGRYVRNIFEQAKMNQASRLLEKDFESITSDEITTITAEDIVIPERKSGEIRRIGFC